MPEELARRGDLVLVRGTAGRACDSLAAWIVREWRWVLICAAPLALQVLGPEPDHRDPPEPEQTTLDVP